MKHYEELEFIAGLFLKESQFLLSNDEKLTLDTWKIANPVQAEQLKSFLSSGELFEALNRVEVADTEIRKRLLHANIPIQLGNTAPVYSKPVHRVHLLKTAWFRYAAAIIILFGIGVYFYTTQQTKNPQLAETKPAPVENDILPGKNRAVLTLSNGQKVELDSAASETILDGNLSIKNNNGQLVYKGNGIAAINTMSTPKGGQYKLVLADGTKVWLNAGSSISYPTTFEGNTREVSIKGEAYFEVTTNKQKPFIVKTIKETIAVLGTAFNVNAYADEPASKTSLLEGTVKINGKILQPGEAYVNGSIIKTNVQRDLAWKSGYFNFYDKTLREVMRELSRWYDLSIVYDEGVREMLYVGEVPRSLTLKEVLKGMEGAGIHFELKDKNILVVKP